MPDRRRMDTLRRLMASPPLRPPQLLPDERIQRPAGIPAQLRRLDRLRLQLRVGQRPDVRLRLAHCITTGRLCRIDHPMTGTLGQAHACALPIGLHCLA